MENHLVSFFLASIIYGFPLMVIYKKEFARSYQTILFLYFFFLVLIFFKPYVNASKFANFVAYENITGEINIPTFYLNSILLYPIYFFIKSKEIVFGLNAFLSFLVSLIAYNSTKVKSNKKHYLSLNFLLAALFIPNIYYSFFGLRDQLILIILYFLSKSFIHKNINSIVILSLLIIVIRPELIILVGLFFLWEFLSNKSNTTKIIYLVFIVVSGFLLFPYLGYLLGIGIIDDPAELIKFSENRYLRHASEIAGGGSHILGGNLFSLNFFQRFPLQLLAFFINPLPIDFKNISYLVPFIDSLVFIYFFRKFINIKNNNSNKFTNLFLAFISLIIILSIFNSNYGNLFRLRYPFYGIMFGAFRIYNTANR
jgi:hypothetical protein